jgi:predicted KAP-like P-loop ATPase
MNMQRSDEEVQRPTAAWLDDEPIRTSEDDLLGRLPFARQVARILNSAGRRSPSTVVGLTGPWGSGKTSTVHLVRANLDDSISWRVQDVNPWGLNGAEAVVAEVLAAVTSALPKKRAKRARKAMSKYVAFATPLVGLAPYGGSAAKQVADVLAARLAGEQTLTGQAAEVEQELTQLAQPILVVIDDIDRLQPPELLALFKAVRLLGRLPHVHYLLSYDQRTITELITSTPIAQNNEDRAAAFMEKLINVRVDQPPTRPDQVKALYDSRMRTALTELSVELSQGAQLRINDEHQPLLAAMLREPRTIGRFFAQLYTYIPLLGPDEIDLSDFIGLSLIRTAVPSLYERVAVERHVLTGAEIVDWDSPMG